MDFLKNKKIFYLVVLVIIALSIFLRVNKLTESTIVMGDTGRDILVAKKICQGKSPLNPYLAASSGIQNTPVYYWIVATFWCLSGSLEGTIFVYSLFIAIASPIVFYKIGAKLRSREFGLALSLLAGVHPYLVYISRWIWQPNLLIIFTPTLYLSYLKLTELKDEKKIILYYLLFLLIGNIGIHVHFSFILIFFFLTGDILLKIYKKNKKLFTILLFPSIFSILIRFLYITNLKNKVVTSIFNLDLIYQKFIAVLYYFDDAVYYFNIDSPFKSPHILFFTLIAIFILSYQWKKNNPLIKNTILTKLSVLPIFTIFYPQSVLSYFYTSEIVIFFIVILLVIFYIFEKIKNKYLKTGYILLFIYLYIQFFTGSKALKSQFNEIYLVTKISNKVYEHIIENNIDSFSISVENHIYGYADSPSTSNAIIWLLLEDLLKKDLVKISSKKPTIAEPQKFTKIYTIEVDDKDIDETKYAEDSILLDDYQDGQYIVISVNDHTDP